MDYEYNGYGDSSEFQSRAAMGGLVYGAVVGFLLSIWNTCCATQESREDRNINKAVVNFASGIVLSGLLGYGLPENNNDVSLGKFMASLAVGGAVIALPVLFALACCGASCFVCIDSVSSSRLLSTDVDDSTNNTTTTTTATGPRIFSAPVEDVVVNAVLVTVEDVVVNADNHGSIQQDDSDVEAQHNSQAIVVARKIG